ncbi:MAG: extracellular solute-binding protein [Pseudomonadota bacterium]
MTTAAGLPSPPPSLPHQGGGTRWRKWRSGPLARIAALALLALLAPDGFCAPSHAAEEVRHGLSAFGTLKYPPDFKHFAYVNPDAPKGGRLALIGSGGRITFDSFNGYILKGDAAQGLEYLFDSLMVRAFDEPDAVYGLVAKSASVAADRKSVTFELRPEARFADGSPVTADDVVFSFEALKTKGHPTYSISLKDVAKAEALAPDRVRYTFEGELVRDLPMMVAMLPVLSKTHYATRRFDETTLEPPLGSGPYAIADFKPGTYVLFRRRPDYWAKDLPVNRGRFNFDELKYEYYRDRTAELEALKAGSFDFREEFTSIDWATGYDIPAVRDGRLQRLTLPDDSPSGAQGFFINTRRDKLKDPRVRRALDLAFDFEWTNKNLFFDLYKRTTSFFENSDMKASGPPDAAELALLEPFRDRLPKEVFGEPYLPPVTDGSGTDRRLLREAARLLSEAGWEIKEGKRTNAKGEPLELEILIFAPTFERVIGPYVENLKRLGIAASLRRVDAAQFERRVKAFDFDITVQRYVMRLTPGVELRNYWSSEAARTDGSFNLAGIADPVVDALVAKVMAAHSREELLAATRAIDRVLRAGHYWVPHWYKAAHHLAFWDKLARPAIKPKYERGVIHTWWYDAEKAAKLAGK